MWWTVGFLLGGVIVVVVAALLIAILLVARNIERLAGQALGVAGEIKAATRPVWALADANDILEDIAGTVRSVEAQVTLISDELAPESASGGERGVGS
jgi:hypothetical protein